MTSPLICVDPGLTSHYPPMKKHVTDGVSDYGHSEVTHPNDLEGNGTETHCDKETLDRDTCLDGKTEGAIEVTDVDGATGVTAKTHDGTFLGLTTGYAYPIAYDSAEM